MEVYAVKILNISEENLNKLCLFISTENKWKIGQLTNRRDKIRTLIGEILVRFIVMEKLKIKNMERGFLIMGRKLFPITYSTRYKSYCLRIYICFK